MHVGAEARVGGYARCVCNMYLESHLIWNLTTESARIVRTGGSGAALSVITSVCESQLAHSFARAIVSSLRRDITWAQCSLSWTSAVLRSVSMRPNVTRRSLVASASRRVRSYFSYPLSLYWLEDRSASSTRVHLSFRICCPDACAKGEDRPEQFAYVLSSSSFSCCYRCQVGAISFINDCEKCFFSMQLTSLKFFLQMQLYYLWKMNQKYNCQISYQSFWNTTVVWNRLRENK